VTKVPAFTSLTLLRTGEPVQYSYADGTLVIPNPAAGPDGLHEVFEIIF
jgi:alpha-L-fucosidase